MRKVTKNIYIVLSIIICSYIAINLTNIIKPNPQFVFDLTELDNKQIAIYTYHLNGTKFIATETNSGIYHESIDSKWFGKKYDIRIMLSPDKLLEQIEINDKVYTLDSKSLFKVSNFTTNPYYQNLYVIKEKIYNQSKILIFLILLSIISVILYTIYKISIKGCSLYEKLLYSKSSINILGYRPIALSIIITLLTLIIYHGCDLNVLSETICMHQSGIDIYQLFSSVNKHKGIELMMWTYDFSMLIFYDIAMFANRLFLGMFNPNSYHIIQTIILKLINVLLLNMTILSVLSFMIDEGYIAKKSIIKNIYFWSIFNPLTFYIAIIFIQLDAFPLYCITIGLLFMMKLDKNYALSALFITIGISAKAQLFLLLPIILTCIAFIRFEKVVSNKTQLKFYFFIILNFSLVLILPRLLDTPLKYALSNAPQAQRAWFTTLQYAPNVYLYISIFVLTLFVMLNLFAIHLQVKFKNLVMNGIYFIAIICLLLSFSILSTPSIMINTLPAFVLVYAFSKDNFQKFIIAALGLLIASSEMFTSVGDITATLNFFGAQPFFTYIETNISNTPEGIKLFSIIFTVSHTAMLGFGIFFYKKSQLILKNKF